MKKITDYQPLQRNPNKGNQRGTGILNQSVRELGAGRSILVDKNGVILAGNHAQEAFVNAGIENVIEVETDGSQIVVVKRTDMDADSIAGQKMAIMDNRTVEVGLEWDNIVLEEMLEEIKASDGELDRFLEDLAEEEKIDMGGHTEGDTEAQIDKAEELRVKWGVESGQLWQLGDHRIICGDCTDKSVVDRVMGGEKAELLFTSPPYSDIRTYKNDGDLSPEHLSEFITASLEFVNIYAVNLEIKREEGEIKEYWQAYINTAKNGGLHMLAWNVWSRHGFGGSIGNMTAMFPIEHEWVFVFGAEPKEINLTVPNKHGGKTVSATVRAADGNMGARHTSDVRPYGRMGSVFVSDMARGEKDHPATFPVEFPEAYIEACTNPSDTVYEPFLGSGTTLIACENLHRKCRAIEISPAYVAVAIERWYQHTGKEPVRLE